MNLIESVKTCLKKYGVIDGRASRSEYWYFVLFYLLMNFILGAIEGLLGLFQDYNRSVLASIVSLFFIIPYITVSVRRLHDINRTGWWQLLSIIPIIGWIVLFFFHIKKSDDNDNRFGSNPLQ